jgi:hypothetical protein
MNIDWRGWTAGQWALRLVVVLAPMLALVVRGQVLGGLPPWALVVMLALCVGWALAPESVAGVAVLVLVGWSWAGATGEPSAAVLAAAAAMLVAHLAALVLSYGPDRLPVQWTVVRVWAVRGAMVFPTAVVAWLLARGVRELPDSDNVWVVGIVVALTVVVVATVTLQSLMPRAGDE